MSNNEVYHTPVLLKESVDGMLIAPDSICIDVTSSFHQLLFTSLWTGMVPLWSVIVDNFY